MGPIPFKISYYYMIRTYIKIQNCNRKNLKKGFTPYIWSKVFINRNRKSSLMTQLKWLHKDLISLYLFSLVLCFSPQLRGLWSASSSRAVGGLWQVLGCLEAFTRNCMMFIIEFLPPQSWVWVYFCTFLTTVFFLFIGFPHKFSSCAASIY